MKYFKMKRKEEENALKEENPPQPLSLPCPHPMHTDCSLQLSNSETKIQRLEEARDVKEFMTLWNSFMHSKSVRAMKVLMGLSSNKMKIAVIAFMAEIQDKLTPQLKAIFQMHLLTLYEYKQLSFKSMMCCLAELNSFTKHLSVDDISVDEVFLDVEREDAVKRQK